MNADDQDNLVTIQNLEVSFQVDGDGDEAVFARLFEKYVKHWNRLECDAKARHSRVESERSLNGHKRKVA